jgi:IclR family mhp operon transcriptional activator
MTRTVSDTAYKQVQGLSRGLAVLRALSDSEQGRAQLSDVSARTSLHRTTVRRLLETLKEEGFVERSGDDGAFQLTQAIKQLGDRFTVYDRVAEVALPILESLSLEVTWPCALATPDEDVMVIRAATHHLSPLSFHRGVIGRRLPMLATAMGRAYLAFSSDAARRQTLDLIAAKYESGEVPTMSLATFRQILLKTQQDGYGANFGEWVEDKKVSAIAVPVRAKKGLLAGCVNIVAVTRAIKPHQLATRFLGPLREAASLIERSLAETPNVGSTADRRGQRS